MYLVISDDILGKKKKRMTTILDHIELLLNFLKLRWFFLSNIRGNALAEYLIDGDPLHKRRKSVSQVKKESAETIEKCRRIAVDYHERLFMLYCNGDDPYFGPT